MFRKCKQDKDLRLNFKELNDLQKATAGATMTSSFWNLISPRKHVNTHNHEVTQPYKAILYSTTRSRCALPFLPQLISLTSTLSPFSERIQIYLLQNIQNRRREGVVVRLPVVIANAHHKPTIELLVCTSSRPHPHWQQSQIFWPKSFLTNHI